MVSGGWEVARAHWRTVHLQLWACFVYAAVELILRWRDLDAVLNPRQGFVWFLKIAKNRVRASSRKGGRKI